MNQLRALLKFVVRWLVILLNQLTLQILRLKGVCVHPTARVHPLAVIEPSGGSIKIGPRTFIDRGVILRALNGSIQIGENCSIHAYSVLYGGGGLTIGNDVRIATHTVIVPSNHIYHDASLPIHAQGLSLVGISVEDDVWIGAASRILDGVRIAKGTVVGSGAVVTRTTEPNSVVVGVPAKAISSRA